MTPEENKRRAEDEHVNYIRSRICDRKGDKPFIFISYKSDDWETVLHDIVYRLVKEYGLNVYFDGSFDFHNSLWISQFPDNMEHFNCRGVLAFFDNNYATSYATLLELMYSRTYAADNGSEGLPVVPVNLDRLTKIGGVQGEENTGLGVEFFEDGTKNINAESEKELFDDTFDELIERKILRKAKYLYKKEGLIKKRCSEIVGELIASLKVNENYYEKGKSLDGIVKSIKDACGSGVFSKLKEPVTDSPGTDKYSRPDEENKSESGGKLDKDSEQERKRKLSGTYTFTFNGKSYENYKLKNVMLAVFEDTLPRHSDKLDELIFKLPCVGEGDLIRKDAKPAVFRAGKVIFIDGRQISVGTSLDARAVFNYIDRLLNICGEQKGCFIVEKAGIGDGVVPESGLTIQEHPAEVQSGAVTGSRRPDEDIGTGKKRAAGDVYFFTLYGIRYEDKKLKDLILTVFKEVMARHVDQLDRMLEILPCLGEGNLIRRDAKPTVFRAGEVIAMGGREISIGTSLGRDAVMNYIGKLMRVCRETKENLTIDNYDYYSK